MTQEQPGRREPAVPSGRQVSIIYDRQQAVVVEVGGGVRSYAVAGRDVLDGYAVDERCTDARGQPLIPWPNRLRGGRYEWEGQQLQAPINEVDKGNALHGYTLGSNWDVTAVGQQEAVASLRLHPQEGYPFLLDLAVRYALGPGGLTVSTTARNVGTAACPYAHGAHPYITVGTERIDQAELTIPAATYLPTDEAQIPVGRRPVQGTAYDFRRARTLGRTSIDHAFTDLTRDSDGRARVVLSSPAGRSVTVWLDAAYTHLMIFTGDTIAATARRRRGLGVEPMTCPPNAFATGDALRLEPGQEITTSWGITAEEEPVHRANAPSAGGVAGKPTSGQRL